MSTGAVTEFLNQVSSDSALQSELSKALEADSDREAVTALAKSKGFVFSSDELWSEVQKRQTELQSRQASGELSDEELEAVAGGGTPALVVWGGAGGASAGLSISQIRW